MSWIFEPNEATSRAIRHMGGTEYETERGRSRSWPVALAALGAYVGVRALRRRKVEAGVSTSREVSWLGRRLDPYRNLAHDDLVLPSLPPAQVVSLPGRGEVVVRRAGPVDGVPVLLIHGWMATADLNWFQLYGELARTHPVVAFDLRGHGRGIRSHQPFSLEDCADDAAEVLRQLGIDRAIAVGYSMGGPVALLLWRRHPELVAGLVLEATALAFNLEPFDRFVWSLLGVIGVLLRWPTGRIVLLRLAGAVESIPEDLLGYRAWADGEFRRNDPMEIVEAGRALSRFDARPFAGAIDVPTAVVVTTGDRMVSPRRQRALAQATGARVFEFSGDHSAVGFQAGLFAGVTLEAIASVSGDRAVRTR